jgi:hypothetical protein
MWKPLIILFIYHAHKRTFSRIAAIREYMKPFNLTNSQGIEFADTIVFEMRDGTSNVEILLEIFYDNCFACIAFHNIICMLATNKKNV